jgi:serine/threonine-protein kinase
LALYRAAAEGDRGPGCYVLKTPGHSDTLSDVARALLRREAMVAAAVNHANLVSVVATHLDDSRSYLVLPYLEGVALRRLALARLSVTFALGIARQVAGALALLHDRGWLHGQVRPEHVIVSPPGHATLIDLTEARHLESYECEVGEWLAAAPICAAPEMNVRHSRVSAAADIYALGVLLYEMIAGRPPFIARSPRDLLRCHLREAPPEIGHFRRDAPREVNELLQRMLAKEPLRRPSGIQVGRWLAELEIHALATPSR